MSDIMPFTTWVVYESNLSNQSMHNWEQRRGLRGNFHPFQSPSIWQGLAIIPRHGLPKKRGADGHGQLPCSINKPVSFRAPVHTAVLILTREDVLARVASRCAIRLIFTLNSGSCSCNQNIRLGSGIFSKHCAFFARTIDTDARYVVSFDDLECWKDQWKPKHKRW